MSQTSPNTPLTPPATEAADPPVQPYTVDLQKVMQHLQSTDPGEFDAATRQLNELVTLDPNNGMVLMGLGISHARRQQWQPAIQFFERAVKAAPKYAPAQVNLGNLYRQFGRKKESRVAYNKAIELQPGFADAHYNLSLLNEADGKLADAEAAVRRALLFRPNYPEAHNNLGHLLIQSGKVDQALSHFRQALAWAPGLLPAQFNLILALYRLGRSTEAQAEVDRVLAAEPDNVQVLRVQASGLMQMGMLDAAENVNAKLLSLQPDAPDLRMNHAEVLLARGDSEGALSTYRQLLNQRLVPPAVGMGAMANAMRVQGHYSEAKNLYQQALMMDNRLPALVMGMARVLVESGEVPLGLASWRRAVQMLPHAPDVHAGLIDAMRFDPDCKAEALQAEMKRWDEVHTAAQAAHAYSRAPHVRKEGEELRIGIVLGAEPDAVTLASVMALQQLKQPDFGLFVYHGGTIAGTALLPLQEAADHWRPVGSLGSADMAEQIRQDAIDVLVDTVGFGQGSKLSVFALKPAPIRLSWLGDFSADGTAGIDTLLCDEVVAPPGEGAPQGKGAPGARRNVVVLPSMACWRPPENAPDVDGALPGGLVLGVVSPLSHINQRVLDVWAALLLALPEAKLLIASPLSVADEVMRTRLTRLFMLRDVEPERIAFESVQDAAQKYGALSKMTVVLDSFPVTMGLNQALECVWMGVPVLTLAGTEPWARLTASALAQVGLSDWAAASVEDYVALGCHKLAQPDALSALRPQLRQRLQAAPMLNREAFVAGFEAAITKLWDEAVVAVAS